MAICTPDRSPCLTHGHLHMQALVRILPTVVPIASGLGTSPLPIRARLITTSYMSTTTMRRLMTLPLLWHRPTHCHTCPLLQALLELMRLLTMTTILQT